VPRGGAPSFEDKHASGSYFIVFEAAAIADSINFRLEGGIRLLDFLDALKVKGRSATRTTQLDSTQKH
jgi:hypothetical protein